MGEGGQRGGGVGREMVYERDRLTARQTDREFVTWFMGETGGQTD